MKKTGSILIFIFLTGLFAGIFFSINLSNDSISYLSSVMLAGISSSNESFIKIFFSSLSSNLLLFAIMAPALFLKYLKPLPVIILWYKGFATGFCSSLLYASDTADVLTVSLLKIIPQNLFFIPSFLIFSTALFMFSGKHEDNPLKTKKKSRSAVNTNGLPLMLSLSLALLIIGAFIQGIFHLIAL